MNSVLLAVAAAVIIGLIVHSLYHRDRAAEACAKEVIQLLRKNQQASAEDIAAVYRGHARTKDDIEKVTPLIQARLTHAHIRKDDHPLVMQRVRQAKSLLKE